jgi:hypothetical protein
MSISVRSPQCRVNFFTERGNVSVSHRFQDTRTSDQLISVTTHKDLRQPAGTFSVVLTAERFQGDISHFRVFAAPSGGDSLADKEINRTFGWRDLLRPGDLVIIELGPDRSQTLGTYYEKNFTRDLYGQAEIVMIGAIDDVRMTTEVGPDGSPTRRVTVSGRDFGKYLVDDMVWDSPWWNEVSQTLAFRNGIAGLQGLPASIIQHVVQRWIFQDFDVEFDVQTTSSVKAAGRRRLSEILRLALDADTPEVPYGNTWLSYEGSPWAFFQEIQGPPFYQLLLDTRRADDVEALLQYRTAAQRVDTNQEGDRHVVNPVATVAANVQRAAAPLLWNTNLSHYNTQVTLLYYRTPFSNRFYEDWTRLPTRTITTDDVVSEDVGTSLEEVFTRWLVLPQAPNLNRRDFKTAAEKQQDAGLERRFGYRPRILRVPFFNDTGDVALFRLGDQLQKTVRDWDRHNLDYLSGRYVIRGMAQVRVGDRLHYDSQGDGRGIDYYVEGVTQEYQAFASWRTTLEVTRGQIHRDAGVALFDQAGKAPDIRAVSRTG